MMIAQIKRTSNEIFKRIPHFLGEVLMRYLRVKVHGLENIPAHGAGLIISNHSGFSGFDVFVLAHMIRVQKRRIPRVLSHPLWFLTKTTGLPAQKLGFVEATIKNGIHFLKKKNLVVIFPEGEHGNFKKTSKRYELQEFKRGFVRMALEAGAPIIPVLIIGAEETSITLSQIQFPKALKSILIPLPLNILPLPVKWEIHFLEPIELPYSKEAASDPELIREIAEEIQETMQEALRKRVRKHRLF